MADHVYHVYVLASRTRRVYIGVTGDLRRRLWQHEGALLPGFTRRYGITRLVHVEAFRDVREAITREKQLKRWPRWRKERLIAAANPMWLDLRAADDDDVRVVRHGAESEAARGAVTQEAMPRGHTERGSPWGRRSRHSPRLRRGSCGMTAGGCGEAPAG
jgi:putative endonuclease